MSGRAAEIYRFDRLVGMRLLVSKRLPKRIVIKPILRARFYV